jgi:hypothetical protein
MQMSLGDHTLIFMTLETWHLGKDEAQTPLRRRSAKLPGDIGQECDGHTRSELCLCTLNPNPYACDTLQMFSENSFIESLKLQKER